METNIESDVDGMMDHELVTARATVSGYQLKDKIEVDVKVSPDTDNPVFYVVFEYTKEKEGRCLITATSPHLFGLVALVVWLFREEFFLVSTIVSFIKTLKDEDEQHLCNCLIWQNPSWLPGVECDLIDDETNETQTADGIMQPNDNVYSGLLFSNLLKGGTIEMIIARSYSDTDILFRKEFT